jgi:hypothetical protein
VAKGGNGAVSAEEKYRVYMKVTIWLHQKRLTHPPMSSDSEQNNDLVRNSSLYREFQAEREEILKHKWIESEKAGYDIGFEQALTDWILRHRSKWRKNRQTQSQ